MVMGAMTVSAADTARLELRQPLPLQCLQIVPNRHAVCLKNPESGPVEGNQGAPSDTTHHNSVNTETRDSAGRVTGAMSMGLVTVVDQTEFSGIGIRNQKTGRGTEVPVHQAVKPLIIHHRKTDSHTILLLLTVKLHMHKIASPATPVNSFIHMHKTFNT